MLKTTIQKKINTFVSFTIPKGSSFLLIDQKGKRIVQNSLKSYDYIVINNVLEDEQDIQLILKKMHRHLNDDGKIIVIYKNYLYSFLHGLLESLFAQNKKTKKKNWLSTYDLTTFLSLSGFETILQQPVFFMPITLPVIDFILNTILLLFFPFNHFCAYHYIIAKKANKSIKDSSVSIIIPARNEQGNIKKLFEQLPVLGTSCEVLFIEGHSKDNTRAEISRNIMIYKSTTPFVFKLLIQTGIGKGDAVNTGFDHASGDILIIYDADMTVDPLDLHKFYIALISGEGEFINGSRLVYPMQGEAMQFMNILGNKFFSILYSWLLGQRIKDTLCGTKALWRKDYIALKKNRFFSQQYDPFGDFKLLLGASRMNLQIIDLPVRYRERTYGATNIQRFINAWELLKLSFFSFKMLKLRKYR